MRGEREGGREEGRGEGNEEECSALNLTLLL